MQHAWGGIHKKIWMEILKERDYLEDLVVVGKIILKRIIRK
jgi:hypothetical protein